MTRRNCSKMALVRAAMVTFSLISPFGTVAGAKEQVKLFAPRLIVNGQVVSNYEFNQRVKFLQVLRIHGDIEKEAIKALTTDKLSAQEANRLGITITPEEIEEGMREFASQANLDVPAFIKILEKEGVEPETFRDFVSSGLLWRVVVRQKFGDSVRISDVQIDRALAEAERKSDVKLLLSELVVPVPQDVDPADVLPKVKDIKANIRTKNDFASAARKYSSAPTAERGGKLEWLQLSNLPSAVSEQLVGLGLGEVSEPVITPQAVMLFQLDGIKDSETTQPMDVKVKYAQFTLNSDQDGLALVASLDECDDLYPITRGLPADRLKISEELSMSAVPQDIGLVLAKLDPGEAVVRGQNGYKEILMLCTKNGIQPAPAEAVPVEGETAATPTHEQAAKKKGDLVKSDPTREAMREQLGNRQLAAQADAYMEELRSEAIIETP